MAHRKGRLRRAQLRHGARDVAPERDVRHEMPAAAAEPAVAQGRPRASRAGGPAPPWRTRRKDSPSRPRGRGTPRSRRCAALNGRQSRAAARMASASSGSAPLSPMKRSVTWYVSGGAKRPRAPARCRASASSAAARRAPSGSSIPMNRRMALLLSRRPPPARGLSVLYRILPRLSHPPPSAPRGANGPGSRRIKARACRRFGPNGGAARRARRKPGRFDPRATKADGMHPYRREGPVVTI